MDNKLTILKLSEKIKAYIEEVKKETGYNVSIKSFPDKGARVTLDHRHKYIRVRINEGEFKNESEEEIDYTIAHEVTHEFLSLKKKYCRIKLVNCGPEEKEAIFFLSTMIEDIVVDKIIHEKNYIPCFTTYRDDVKRDIKFICDKGKGEYFCEKYNDPTYKSKNKAMIFSYILAWGYLTYSNSDKIDKKTLYKHLKIFQKLCPKHYEEAKKIKEIIFKNDIFTTKGYNNAIKECLYLWNLKDLVDVYICVKKNGNYDRKSI
ncbi:hypothetical protein ES708_23381 [subsurface metagenome]